MYLTVLNYTTGSVDIKKVSDLPKKKKQTEEEAIDSWIKKTYKKCDVYYMVGDSLNINV
jgi:hypothetical protein